MDVVCMSWYMGRFRDQMLLAVTLVITLMLTLIYRSARVESVSSKVEDVQRRLLKR